MLKRKAVNKLPTLLQYLKEHELKESKVKAPIEKIFWSDDWCTITFQTDIFRYSIKFGSDEEYQEATKEILDAYNPKKPMDAWVVYGGDDDGDVDIVWEPESKVGIGLLYVWFKQWDWGLTGEKRIATQKDLPASRKKPSSKIDPDTPPSQLDPTL